MSEDSYQDYELRKFMEDPEKWRSRLDEIVRQSREDRLKREMLAEHNARSIVYEERPSRFLYVIADVDRDEVKVGYSGNVANRLRGLQSGRPTNLHIYAREAVDCLRPRETEARAHAPLKRHRLRGEWFNCHPEVALAAVRRAAWEAEDSWQADDA